LLAKSPNSQRRRVVADATLRRTSAAATARSTYQNIGRYRSTPRQNPIAAKRRRHRRAARTRTRVFE
jgi:hypothetical protein